MDIRHQRHLILAGIMGLDPDLPAEHVALTAKDMFINNLVSISSTLLLLRFYKARPFHTLNQFSTNVEWSSFFGTVVNNWGRPKVSLDDKRRVLDAYSDLDMKAVRRLVIAGDLKPSDLSLDCQIDSVIMIQLIISNKSGDGANEL